MAPLDLSPRDLQACQDLRVLLLRRFEPGGHVSPRDEQRVPGAHGERIPERQSEGPGMEDPPGLGCAEGAAVLAHGQVPGTAAAGEMTSRPPSPAWVQTAQRH